MEYEYSISVVQAMMDMGILATWSRQDRVKCALTVDVYAPHRTVRVAAELLSLVLLAF
jgi:hypothetical protein